MEMGDYSKYIHFYVDEVPDLLLQYLKSVDWKSYLDLGCGDGTLLLSLKNRGLIQGKKVYAVDLSESRISLVKLLDPGFHCYVSSASNVIAIGSGTIDWVTSTQVIEHVPSDDAMVSEISRILSPGGHVYLSTVLKRWYGWYFFRCNGRWVLDPTHVREYTEESQLLDLLKRHGVEVIEARKVLFRFPLIDFIFRRLRASRDVYSRAPLRLLRKFKIPIPGYYCWEMLCRKCPRT